MADENLSAEEAAEEVLVGAVMSDGVEAPDATDLDDQDKAGEPDEPDDVTEEAEAKEGEDEPEKKAEDKADKDDEPEDDEIEIPGEDGAEPRKMKLSEAVEKALEYEKLEARKVEILDEVEREATTQITERMKHVEQVGQQTAYMLQAALQLLQEPKPPNEDMLNPQSQSYNPEQYHLAFAQFQRAKGQYDQALQVGRQMYAQSQQAADYAKEQRETEQLKKLQRAWPEFGEKDTLDKFIGDMGREYGFSAQELDDVLVDHRQALVAKDALAFRAMKARSGKVKETVEKRAAPKLTRSRAESKGGAHQARNAKGQFKANGDAYGALRKTQSDDAAAAYFADLSRQGAF